MKLKEKKRAKGTVAFDVMLFAARVSSRKPTGKEVADVAERPDDAIEPNTFPTMEGIVDDL
jgi:cellobiose-specific phosphotransferase system component IIB